MSPFNSNVDSTTRVRKTGSHQQVQCPPFRFTSHSFLQSHTYPQPPLLHSVTDPLAKQEMRSPVANYGINHASLLPYMALPKRYIQHQEAPLQALNRILAEITSKKMYVNQRWVEPPLKGPSSPEEQKASFFNWVIRAANGRTQGDPPLRWRSHCNTENDNKRKPDVVLVPSIYEEVPNIPVGAILSYCEVKYIYKKRLANQALLQLTEMAGLATSAQLGRRFYVALSLCGNQLSLACFLRGCTLFTEPFDINDNPIDFLNIILILSSDNCSAWTGFDDKFPINFSGTFTYRFELEAPSPVTLPATGEAVAVETIRPLFRAFGMEGKGTVTCVCEGYLNGLDKPSQFCVLKDCWVNADWPSDIDIHRILNTRPPAPIPADEAGVFGEADEYGIFAGCVKVPDEWDSTIHLPGIPIICEWEEVQHDLPDGCTTQPNKQYAPDTQPDTTHNILRRLRLKPGTHLYYEPRKHIRNLSRTCGVPIDMFSCRRELLGGFMGAIVGHYNGLCKHVLHCDVSESNIWLRVPQLTTEDVVPSWDCQDADGLVQRAGVLGDWGSAQDIESQAPSELKRQGFVTGTFPFIATALLSAKGQKGEIPHTAHHDLESFFWVLWSLSINSSGPYGKSRQWLSGTDTTIDRDSSESDDDGHTTNLPSPTATTSPSAAVSDAQFIPTTNKLATQAYPGTSRCAADANNTPVPVWATRGQSLTTYQEVYMWRLGANEASVCDPISPYFLQGKGGPAFREGMCRLLQYFTPSSSSQAPEGSNITHKQFIDVLRDMRDAIDPQEDRPSAEEVQRAQAEYEKSASLRKGMVLPASVAFLKGNSRSRTGSSMTGQTTKSGASTGTKRGTDDAFPAKAKRVRSSQQNPAASRSRSSELLNGYEFVQDADAGSSAGPSTRRSTRKIPQT